MASYSDIFGTGAMPTFNIGPGHGNTSWKYGGDESAAIMDAHLAERAADYADQKAFFQDTTMPALKDMFNPDEPEKDPLEAYLEEEAAARAAEEEAAALALAGAAPDTGPSGIDEDTGKFDGSPRAEDIRYSWGDMFNPDFYTGKDEANLWSGIADTAKKGANWIRENPWDTTAGILMTNPYTALFGYGMTREAIPTAADAVTYGSDSSKHFGKAMDDSDFFQSDLFMHEGDQPGSIERQREINKLDRNMDIDVEDYPYWYREDDHHGSIAGRYVDERGFEDGGRVGFSWGGWSSPEDADDHAQRMFNKEYKDLTPDELDEFEEEMDRLRNKFSDSGNMQMASAPDPMAERMDTLENMALEQYGKPLDKLSPKEIEILEFELNEMNMNDFYNTGGRVGMNTGGLLPWTQTMSSDYANQYYNQFNNPTFGATTATQATTPTQSDTPTDLGDLGTIVPTTVPLSGGLAQQRGRGPEDRDPRFTQGAHPEYGGFPGGHRPVGYEADEDGVLRVTNAIPGYELGAEAPGIVQGVYNVGQLVPKTTGFIADLLGFGKDKDDKVAEAEAFAQETLQKGIDERFQFEQDRAAAALAAQQQQQEEKAAEEARQQYIQDTLAAIGEGSDNKPVNTGSGWSLGNTATGTFDPSVGSPGFSNKKQEGPKKNTGSGGLGNTSGGPGPKKKGRRQRKKGSHGGGPHG